MKSYKTIVAAVATGLACTAVTSQASFVPLSPGVPVASLPGGADFNTAAAGSLLTSFQSNYSFGAGADAHTGTLTTEIYAYKLNGVPAPSLPISGGYVFIFTLAINTVSINGLTTGLINGLTVGGFTGPVSVNNAVGTSADAGFALYDTTGGITFTWSAAQSGILKVAVDTSSTAWTGGTSTVRASADLSGTAASLAPVPETSTIVAGAFILLPFGIGVIRSLRKNRTA